MKEKKVTKIAEFIQSLVTPVVHILVALEEIKEANDKYRKEKGK